MSSPADGSLAVRTITAEEHLAFIRSVTAREGGSASFLQTPAWAAVKPEWKAESIGWVRGERAWSARRSCSTASCPQVKRYLAYLPEGPLLDWSSEDLRGWLDPMAAHLKGQGAFGIRIGPPVITRRWTRRPGQGGHRRRGGGLADRRAAHRAQPGRRPRRLPAAARPAGGRSRSPGGFAAGQPQYNFQIPLVDEDGAPRTEDDVLKGMNQQWRRNIKKAAKAGRRGRARVERPTSRRSTSSTPTPPSATTSPRVR